MKLGRVHGTLILNFTVICIIPAGAIIGAQLLHGEGLYSGKLTDTPTKLRFIRSLMIKGVEVAKSSFYDFDLILR